MQAPRPRLAPEASRRRRCTGLRLPVTATAPPVACSEQCQGARALPGAARQRSGGHGDLCCSTACEDKPERKQKKISARDSSPAHLTAPGKLNSQNTHNKAHIVSWRWPSFSTATCSTPHLIWPGAVEATTAHIRAAHQQPGAPTPGKPHHGCRREGRRGLVQTPEGTEGVASGSLGRLACPRSGRCVGAQPPRRNASAHANGPHFAAGGLGTTISMDLCRLGVRKITLVDYDVVGACRACAGGQGWLGAPPLLAPSQMTTT